MLRKATPADIPGIIALVNQNLDKLLPRSAEEYLELIDLTWVVEEAGEIVGCATLEVYSPKIAEIRSVAVRHDRRHKGYGGQLVRAAADEAKRRKIHEVMVITSTPEFFQELGFGACLHEKYALFLGGK
ncbi:MAG: GNAT family N-acetyltransferase [Bdellovibrionota bacterium]|nr:MAG: GNAT family N-acetyltransferase [Bdellovibrionota bacterium]